MSIKIGSSDLQGIRIGTTNVSAVYVGDMRVWPLASMDASGNSTPFVVMYIGSSTTEGVIGATDEHHNYVNHFSAMIVTNAMDSLSTNKVIKQNSGTATRPTANGLHFFNAGIGGRTAADYVDSGVLTLTTSLTPNLVIHMVGSNDYKNQVTPATYQSNLQTAINNINTRSPGVKHLLVHSFCRLDVTGNPTYKWEDYRDRLFNLAGANTNVGVVDISDLFAARGVYLNGPDPDDLVWDGDNIHPSNAGHKFIAEAMAQKLNMKLHRAEKIWELDPNTLSLANGAAVNSLATSAGTLEPTPATQTGTQSPTIQNSSVNGRHSLKFDGSNDSLAASFGKSYGLPVTIFVVVRTNTGGTAARPIFSRTTTDHMGYIYAFDTETATANLSRLQAVSNSPQSKNQFNMSSNGWQVLGIVFRTADDQSIYISDINPKATETSAADMTQGPFISSLRFGSNTGLTAFSPMNLAYARLYQGELTQSEIETILNELGSTFNIPINTTPPIVYPEPATGTDVYSNDFTGTNRDLTSDGWVDHSYSTGTYQIFQGRLVPSGVGNYRTYNAYYWNTQLASPWQYARVTIYNTPASADARGGVGLVLRHTGTEGIFFKVSTNGNWYVYHGASNTADQSDPSNYALANGTLPQALAPGDELIVTIEADIAKFYLNNQLLGIIDVKWAPKGRYTGVLISQTNAGELSNFRTGVMATAPTTAPMLWDNFDAITAFTRSPTSGSGIAASGGLAVWNGNTDGQALARHTTVATSNDQYVALMLDTVNSSNQPTGLIIQCVSSPGAYYGLSITTTSVTLIRATGRWRQTINTTYTTASATVIAGSKIEFWNKGTLFYATVDGVTVIDGYDIPGAVISGSTRNIGFGMMRQSFWSSMFIREWVGGDAEMFGK